MTTAIDSPAVASPHHLGNASIAQTATEHPATASPSMPDLRDVACRLERIEVRYGTVRAIVGCTVDLIEGEFTAVIGIPGSGRSTLARIVAGVDEVTLGRMWVDGTDVARITDQANRAVRRREAAILGRIEHLSPHLTPRGHVRGSLALEGVRGPHAKTLATRALVRARIGRMAGVRVARLSYDARLRLTMALAIAASPALIVADDFGAGTLASSDRRRDDREVANALRGFCRESGASALVVTDDPVVAACADRVIVLDEGRVVTNRFAATTDEIADVLHGLATMAILRA